MNPADTSAVPHSLRERVELLGLRFDRLLEDEAIRTVEQALDSERGGWASTVNLDILRQYVASPELRQLFADADLVLADGMPIVWASRLSGDPLPERVAGSSMIYSLVASAARRGTPLFFLGGAGDAAARAAEIFRERHPGLRLDTYAPPFGFETDPAELGRIEDLIRASEARIVLVGLGCPKQERLIASLRRTLPAAWFFSCGISFSFVAGDVQRAPVWVQRIGLEWLHRLAQEPRRLYRRYLVQGPPFLLVLLASALRMRLDHWRHR